MVSLASVVFVRAAIWSASHLSAAACVGKSFCHCSGTLVAINSADDFVNPPELPMMQALIGKVKHGKFVLVPISDETRGHGTHSRPQVFGPYLAAFLEQIAR